jgi:hypothetical protein
MTAALPEHLADGALGQPEESGAVAVGVRRRRGDAADLVFVVPVRTDRAHPQLPAEGHVWRPLR